ncbi:MAG: hypothetical protein ACYDIE_07775 [Candidatus Krumholzibacteriia bacterium]
MSSSTLPAWRLLALGIALLVLASHGCADNPGPGVPAGDLGGAVLSADLDPGQGTFVLQRVDQVLPDRTPISVELIGSNLQVDAATEEVFLDVAIRNGGQQPLYAPALIWLYGLRPAGVTVLNADVVPGLPDTTAAATTPPPPSAPYGFDYTQFLGGDSLLAAGETSAARTWRFHVPGLTGFAFGVRAEFGTVPDLPIIAGRCFLDGNQDGVPQPAELPIPHGLIAATGPDGFAFSVKPDHEGRYAVPVSQAGLYTLQYWPFGRAAADSSAQAGDDRVAPVFTTPNPLTVLLALRPDGRPASFLGADFGVFVAAEEDSLPPAVHTTAPFDSLPGDPYALGESGVTGILMRLGVGFRGCQPDHPFTLYWQEGPELSPVPVVHLILTHDGRGELCDAWFTRELKFDLRPIRAALGGTAPIPLVLHAPDGTTRSYVLRPPAAGEE